MRRIAQLRGQRLSGMERVSVVGFNLRMRRRKKSGGPLLVGVAFLDAGRSWLSRQLNLPISRGLYIPREREQQHTLLMSDSGKGKSSAIRQVLHQIAERGEVAVIYDPGGEYAKEFYDSARGDIILNPSGARCPFYAIADEIEDDAEAMTVAKSLFPDLPHERDFFAGWTRRLFAHLLAQERASWNAPLTQRAREWTLHTWTSWTARSRRNSGAEN